MNITVRVKDVYGQRRIYPACNTSKLLLSMSPTRLTFDERQIDTIKKLGYTIIIEAALHNQPTTGVYNHDTPNNHH